MVDCAVCASRRALGAFSFMVEEGRSTFGIMARI